MIHFWAKTTEDGKPGISVYEHMVNVGCVARCIAEIWPENPEFFHLRLQEVSALAALHDLGKVSPGFQRKCEAWLQENGLLKVARNGCRDTAMESDHGKITHSAVQDFPQREGISRNSAQYLSTILGAHHGKMKFYPEWLAGLASVADWIGSDERFFPRARGTDLGEPSVLALSALGAIGF
ncbi:MAG: CRISPR-associated endonuclease Cas3'' [Syntrophobacteraceae bacterium]|nr:CRISPR-associated endonuclease Cas3'' [Syntrophobacteraceae bacterium]